MRPTVFASCLVVGALLSLPVAGYAQEATLSGVLTDTTGAVLPGVTVTATNEANGNTFVVVTDGSGAYITPVRIGRYMLKFELPGFTSVTRTGLEVLVGQRLVVNMRLSPAAVEEAVTVTGTAPLLNVARSSLGGNVDSRQLSELPVNGRDWKNLVMLVPGSRSNAVGEEPIDRGRGAYQMNIDGQQVTNILVQGAQESSQQPRISRDAIAEFEFIANRFDATQGRSSGVQINAITKSGTNSVAGSLAGYFRDDRFNASDFIQRRVLPYSDQQVSGTLGGPIRRNRLHYFVNWEYEREPKTYTSNSPWPSFNVEVAEPRHENKGGGRVDFQLSPQNRVTARAIVWRDYLPFTAGLEPSATTHPSVGQKTKSGADQIIGTWLSVAGQGRTVNELRIGTARMDKNREPWVKWSKSFDKLMPGLGSPFIALSGYRIGSLAAPQYTEQRTYQISNTLTSSYTARGSHVLKVGGEFMYHRNILDFCNNCNGQIVAVGGPVPPNIETLFPVWNDANTWNLAALSPITVQYRQGFGDMRMLSPRQIYAAWAQEDWTITPKLTLNLGLRYDLYIGAFGEDIVFLPFKDGKGKADKNNVQPRVGFAWAIGDRTVVRGGAGIYYGEVANNQQHWAKAASQQAQVSLLNDRRADFASNPWNGSTPTYDEARQLLCIVNRRPGCIRTAANSLAPPNVQVPHSYQTSIGFQRQLGSMFSVEADYAFNGGRHEPASQQVNLSYNPATGSNYPFTDVSRLPYPDFATVQMDFSEGWSNLHSLQTAFTKRMSNRWQASGTYTLSWLYDGFPEPLTLDGRPAADFPLAPDVGRQYGPAVFDQRHRAVVNGIWDVGYGFQLSGLYFFGSGARFETIYGADVRQTGVAVSNVGGRLRPDGTIVPRNNFVGRPIHRVDLRLQRRLRLGGNAAIDGIFEIYNAFNHENYGSYVTAESNPNYGRPTSNPNVAYQPRMLQLGVRMTF